MSRDFGQFDFAWLATWPRLAQLACWSTLFVEIGYAILVWPASTRNRMVFGAISYDLGSAVTMWLWWFAAVTIALTFSSFHIDPTPRSPVGTEASTS